MHNGPKIKGMCNGNKMKKMKEDADRKAGCA